MTAPWWQIATPANRVDNLGGVEPFGGFPKPDSNIQLPADYPIQALLSGVVTGIDTASAWGDSITIRLDSALNSLATHTAYLHLAGIAPGVHIGEHINAGQLIGYNGGADAAGSQKVPLGFALYAGDQYGSGSAWSLETKQNLQGALNPVPLLNQASNSDPCGPMPADYWTNPDSASKWNSCKAANAIDGSSSSGSLIQDAANSASDATGIPQLLSVLQDPHTYVRAGLVIVGLVLVVGGFFLFVKDDLPQTVPVPV